MNLEKLKQKIILIDQESIILNHDLKKILIGLKEEFGIYENQIPNYLDRLKRKGASYERKINRLYLKAQAILENEK